MERAALTVSLYAPDVPATVAFYEDVLGFRKTASWEDEGVEIWAEVARDGPKGAARIWFFSHAIEGMPKAQLSGVIYVFVDDVDAEAARIGDRAKIAWGPEDQVYGLRELGIEDVNGYLLCFAKDI